MSSSLSLMRHTVAIRPKQVVDSFRTVAERLDLIIDTGTPNIALNQPGVPFIVFDHDDGDWRCHDCLSRLVPIHATGSVTVNVLPVLSSDETDMVPPSLRTNARTCARPIPWPGRSCGPARRNRSKIRWWSFGSMPRPLSVISKIAKPSLRRPRIAISPGTLDLRYFKALSIKLEKICSIAMRSLTISGNGSTRI